MPQTAESGVFEVKKVMSVRRYYRADFGFTAFYFRGGRGDRSLADGKKA